MLSFCSLIGARDAVIWSLTGAENAVIWSLTTARNAVIWQPYNCWKCCHLVALQLLEMLVQHSIMVALVFCGGAIGKHSATFCFCFFARISSLLGTTSAQTPRWNSSSRTFAIRASLLRMFDVKFLTEFCCRCNASITCKCTPASIQIQAPNWYRSSMHGTTN